MIYEPPPTIGMPETPYPWAALVLVTLMGPALVVKVAIVLIAWFKGRKREK
jgi:hypothetical protein